MKERTDYQLEIKLREIGGDEAFAKTYKIALLKEFVDKSGYNEQGLSNHVEGLINQLTMNNKPLVKQDYSKWQICAVNFNTSVGSEIIGLRPAIVYKGSQYLK